MNSAGIYFWNKVLSLALPIVTIALVAYTTALAQGWTILLVCISLLGYTHYILGAYYQHRAWRKRTTYRHFQYWFFWLSAAAFLLMYVASVTELVWLVALLTIPYFVWHGYENEQTLYRRTTQNHLSPFLIGGISAVAVGITLDAFRHASANFTSSLSFSQVLLPRSNMISTDIAWYIWCVGGGLIIIGTLLLGFYALRDKTPAGMFWASAAVGMLFWFWFANPLPYVWFFFLLLGYHFLTWGIHYGFVFWSDTRRFLLYVYQHLVVIFGVLIVSYILTNLLSIPLGLLNTEWFLAFTLAHITTSFLNDEWVQRLLRLS
jgi:hypothetical protein